MEVFLENQVIEEKNAIGTAYTLANNELFYDIGYKVMQNLDESCLLKCHRLKYNGKIKLVYFTSEYEQIEQVFSKAEPEVIGNLLITLFEAFTQIENLGFLNISCVDNRLDKIFVDPITNAVKIIYLPINSIGMTKNKNVFENELKSQLVKMLSEGRIGQTQKTNLIAECLSDGTLRLQDISRRIQSIGGQSVPTQGVQRQEASVSVPAQNGICLQSLNGAFQFQIMGRDFVLGKSREKVDGEITGNSAISRVHCKILYRDGGYYILDMGSSNGTFLEGKKVTTTEPLRIAPGNRIRIANVEFMVRG